MSMVRKKQNIYLDNAASTPIDLRVKKETVKALEFYGNPSSFNDIGREAKKILEDSRFKIARFMGARPEEIIFTSSGSEANNLAIFGLTHGQKPGEVITTPIEHPSVLEPLKELSKRGWNITYLKVNSDGLIDLKDFEKKLNPEVMLVSIIYANNEIGSIQPIKTISKIINKFRTRKLEIDGKPPLFHMDACQAAGYLDMNVNNLRVDLTTLNGSKIYGPRGIGVLYKKRGINLGPMVYGGGQEHGLRAGTENLQAVVGLAKALELIDKKEGPRLATLRDYFIDKIKVLIPDIKINGSQGDKRLANNINISIPGLDSENLLLELDKYGIYAGSGSACTAHSVEPSHILKAIGVENKYLSGVLRLSLGRQTTKKDVNYVLKALPRLVGDLRKRYRK